MTACLPNYASSVHGAIKLKAAPNSCFNDGMVSPLIWNIVMRLLRVARCKAK